MPPWSNRSTAIRHVSAAMLMLVVAVMAMTIAVNAQPLVVKDGDVIEGRTFETGTNPIDLNYLFTSLTVSSTVQFIDCTIAYSALLTSFQNPPDTLVTSQHMLREKPIIEVFGIHLNVLPPNSFTHAVGALLPKYVSAASHYVFAWSNADFAENVTIRVEDAKQPFQPLISQSFITGLHTVIHVSKSKVERTNDKLRDAQLHYPSSSTASLPPADIKDESFVYFESCTCVGCSKAIVYFRESITISRNSAMIFRDIINESPTGSQPFFSCGGAITVNETSILSLIDINTANEFKASTIPLLSIQSIRGKGVIMFARVSMQKSGLDSALQPVDNDNFYVSTKGSRSTGAEMTTAQLLEEKFNVNAANSMNWDGTDAKGDCVQAGLAVPGRETYAKVDGKCTPTCTDANMTALCTKPYDNPCLVLNCELCYRNTRDTCLVCAPHTTSVNSDKCNCMMPHCNVCSDEGVCTECEANYKPNKEGKCRPCYLPYCMQCLTDDECTECVEGYKPSLDGKQCHQCAIDYCTSDGVCGQCADEYKLTNTKKACFHSTMRHCTECSSDDMCMQCAEGYKPSADRKSCLQCTAPNCALCGTNNDCQRCDGGHTLTKKGECISCSLPGCLRCDEGGVCAMCNGDHSVSTDGTGCVPCSMRNCTFCSSGGHCAMCACGMVPTNDGSSCVTCDVANCVHCDLPGDGHTCAECASGYALSDDDAVCKRVPVPPWVVFLIVVAVTVVIVVAGYVGMILYLRYQAKQLKMVTDAVERRRNRQGRATILGIAWRWLYLTLATSRALRAACGMCTRKSISSRRTMMGRPNTVVLPDNRH